MFFLLFSVEGSGSGYVSQTNGFGSGRPKNIWVLQIRILVWDKTQPPDLEDLRVAVGGGGVLQAGELQRIDRGANITAS
jgi:hypothetical protein